MVKAQGLPRVNSRFKPEIEMFNSPSHPQAIVFGRNAWNNILLPTFMVHEHRMQFFGLWKRMIILLQWLLISNNVKLYEKKKFKNDFQKLTIISL